MAAGKGGPSAGTKPAAAVKRAPVQASKQPTISIPNLGPALKPFVPSSEDESESGNDSATPAESPQGKSPSQASITYLKQHPEMASVFDGEYGVGASSQYLQ